MDGLKDHATVAENLKGMLYCLFAAQFKGIEGHGFPFHFVDESHIAGVCSF